MENNENKTIDERKGEFKQAASQTIPVMGLEPKKPSNQHDSKDEKGKSIGCESACVHTCKNSSEW